jgi:hypothetical protein
VVIAASMVGVALGLGWLLPVGRTAQANVQPPRTIEDVGRLSIMYSASEIAQIIAATPPAPVTISDRLRGNTALALIGNTGAALANTTPVDTQPRFPA